MKKISFCSMISILVQCTFGQDLPLFKDVASELAFPVSSINAWGQAWGDYDQDGDLDVLIARYRLPGPGITNYSYVYRNDGTTFTDVSSVFGLSSDADPTWHATWIDFDNDGDTDLQYTASVKLHLLQNVNGVFHDVTQQMNLIAQLPFGGEFYSSAWADYDLDGDLDVAMTALPHRAPRLYLFRNDGDRFQEVREQVGLPVSGYEHMFVITWIDFDHDGDPDFWTAGDDRGRLFRNENGMFTEISHDIGLMVGPTVTSYWFDYDNDGDLDLYTIGYEGRGQANQLLENNNGAFEDVAPFVGADLSRVERDGVYRSLSVGDFDNDGDQDIFFDISEPTFLSSFLLNIEQPDGTFAFGDVAEHVGLSETTDSYSSATTDFNNDGWLDIFCVGVNDRHVFYKNVSTLANHWVGFKLQGTQSNREGIGARVRIVVNGKSQIRTKFAGDGRLVQQLPWIHFGIGAAVNVDSVIVEWPLGKKDVLINVAPDKYHTLIEGVGISGVFEKSAMPQQFYLKQNYPNPFNPTTAIEYAITDRSLVILTIYNLHGEEMIKLVNQVKEPGVHTCHWTPDRMASGVYLCQMHVLSPVNDKSAQYTATKKLMLLK